MSILIVWLRGRRLDAQARLVALRIVNAHLLIINSPTSTTCAMRRLQLVAAFGSARQQDILDWVRQARGGVADAPWM